MRKGDSLLQGRYQLFDDTLPAHPAGDAFVGIDEDNTKHLVKVWPFPANGPDDVQRALWDSELRTLYRVCSSPGAEQTLLVLRDAGVDLEAGCFVMVILLV